MDLLKFDRMGRRQVEHIHEFDEFVAEKLNTFTNMTDWSHTCRTHPICLRNCGRNVEHIQEVDEFVAEMSNTSQILTNLSQIQTNYIKFHQIRSTSVARCALSL